MNEKHNHNNEHGNRGVDPQPDRGNDNKGHKDNGVGKPPVRPTTPGTSHAVVMNVRIFD
ncbi:hypothetical protein [Schinkia azotoformans]|uniref:hypothetical protein n=1 Tax=Schinkia azotoformans TaxID=1454 RepID=UPI002DB8D1BB|nr:hypothetical protein [Schinkia azotoformans]MEC1759898.1 hypothetical protein [Schinkia azotoformans]